MSRMKAPLGLTSSSGKHLATLSRTIAFLKINAYCQISAVLDYRQESRQEVHVRLIALPRPGELEEFDLRRFRVGQVYDLPPHFASVLLISGYAELAISQQRDTAADQPSKTRKPEF